MLQEVDEIGMFEYERHIIESMGDIDSDKAALIGGKGLYGAQTYPFFVQLSPEHLDAVARSHHLAHVEKASKGVSLVSK